ncbi:MAG: TonB family protein [Vicinamibacteraceae bacterium]
MYCDHCQTTVVDNANFCPFCGGKLTEAPSAEAIDPSQAPTVALTIGPCESCGAPSLPGSTLCMPCTRAFESILSTQPMAPMPVPAPVVPMPVEAAEAATLLQPRAPGLPSAPASASLDAATVMVEAAPHQHDGPLADDEEYVEDDAADDLMAEESATELAIETAPAPPAPAFTADSMDWSTPSTSSGEHKAIVALPPWARKGAEADVDAAAEAAPANDAAGEPVPWWERNGQPSPTAPAKPEVARYVPPPSVTAPAPASASLESTLARQAMRPKAPTMPLAVPAVVVTRPAGNRSRSMVIVAALAGVAAIGTPVMWKLAFASKPTTVSALQYESAAAPEPVSTRPDRVHGAPAPAPAPRVYQDLQPVAAEPTAPLAPIAAPIAAVATPATHAAPRPSPKKAAPAPVTPEPIAAPVVAPEPAPLLVSTPPPVAAAPTAAAAPPTSVHAEAVPLGQIFEVSQVEARPSVTSRFNPVLPARIGTATPVVVIVRVLVSPSGRAVESSAVKNPTSDAGVAAAAAATVRQWSFSPARKKGQAVSCWFNVGVVFQAASGN